MIADKNGLVWINDLSGGLLDILCAQYGVKPEGDCLVWTRGRNRWGYGTLRVGGRNENGGSHWMAHRLFYHLLIGAIPEGNHLHHACGNKPCVNPMHLQSLTASEHYDIEPNHQKNLTHCKSGHEWTPNNIRWRNWYDATKGKTYKIRRCVECDRVFQRRKAAKRAARSAVAPPC